MRELTAAEAAAQGLRFSTSVEADSSFIPDWETPDWVGMIRGNGGPIPGIPQASGWTWEGTGSIIGPHHVLTCAHNLWDIEFNDIPIFMYDNWSATFAPKQTHPASDFPLIDFTCVAYDHRYWGSQNDHRYDLALGILVENTTTAFISPWIALSPVVPSGDYYQDRVLSVEGYATFEGSVPGQCYHTYGDLVGWSADQAEYTNAGASGMSGGPVCLMPIDWLETAYITGFDLLGRPARAVHFIHTNAQPVPSTYHRGVRLTDDKQRAIVSMICQTQTGFIQVPAARCDSDGGDFDLSVEC